MSDYKEGDKVFVKVSGVKSTAIDPNLLSKIVLKDADSAFDKQVGGDHYKSMAIQPVEFILANNLGFCEANIIKYTCRYKQKGGVEDLNKVIHYAQLLIEHISKEKE